ncbi:ATP-dependent helicase HrpB [Pseudohalocynthiibacter aestuariivivens]|uniref:ATP-dependent helicase HrpB n=1 Tax=Pseudohalocynthiibacter aestuariivivens TaxID=1591409 RepID=A0ABV5JD44_9RHOB|nr:ATP-dependent helicase HrpB [Pseudohalocynthiibacter aestuariivivens]MBS9717136.1 ATP-dependent helicase HrpB [Pseudohalocynthiibacter aestuariivivens]
MITDKGHVIQELPIDEALPALISALRADGRAVLQAPPGAGKTTRVPLAMHKAELCKGRILMLEPRRLATRAAAERMAQTLGEKVGQTVGYRIRGESKVSPATRIEVVTEGILTRMIQSDSELNGVGAVIFDEFHERSLNADLGLALAWELRSALREDLILLVMSATLDAEPVAKMMANAPVITSEGRAFPVETYWLDRPISKGTRFDASVAALVEQAVAETTGGVLVFLPGEGEIRQVEARLKGRLPNECTVHPLFGAMSFAAQRKAIAPVREGRKIVLATAIAETSLTIEDIRVVVDGGRARRARFDAGSGMSRLVTERVTKAEAEQRKGRAGRVAKGQCYRHWTKGEEGGLQPFPPAEIQSADLSGFVLELALWGTADPSEMAFLTAPNPGAYAEAQSLLQNLGALDTKGRITPHGRRLATLPLHPRLAHMLARAGRDAALLAALLADRDPLARNAPVDLTLRAEALRDPDHFQATRGHSANRGTIERIKAEARRLASLTKPTQTEVLSLAEQAALAYPDRIGQRRKGEAPRWVLSGGKGAAMSEDDPLAGARFIVATDLDGDTREAKIRQAIEITEAEIRALLGEQIQWHRFCEWSKRDRRVVAREQERLGALILSDRLWRDAPDNQVARAALDGIADLGLPFNTTARRFQARAELVRAGSDRLPDMSDTALMDALDDWLLPHLGKARTAEDIKSIDLLPALKARLDWDQTKLLDQLAPSHFTTPLGNRIPVDYSGEDPSIEIRLQELFGLTRHPTVGPNRTPLRITLLSPARRPVQVTMDLPGFWAASYSDVRKDMRGRYPRHPWPEDPTKANPTLRAKRRGD